MFTYLVNWCRSTHNGTALDIPKFDGKTTQDRLLGKTDDISHLLMNGFYDPFKYTLKADGENTTYPKEKKDQSGRYLGLACNAAEFNAYYVLTQQGRVVTRTDVRPFSVERLWYPVFQKRIKFFDKKTQTPMEA